jgi:hypothetical protein
MANANEVRLELEAIDLLPVIRPRNPRPDCEHRDPGRSYRGEGHAQAA